MTKPEPDQDKLAVGTRDGEHSPTVMGADRRFTLAGALIVLSVALGMLLIWRTSSSLLIIFAGILFASFLDACARSLGFVRC